MSIWVYTKSKDGKRSLTSISVPYEFILLSLGLIAGIMGPALFSKDYPADFVRCAFFICCGFVLFLLAKLFQFSAGRWITWGWGGMPWLGKALYLTGYLLMVCGVAGAFLSF